MEIKDLEPGQQAPDDSDHIVVHRLPNGKFRFDGGAWTGGAPQLGVQHNEQNDGEFDTQEEAREAGIEWVAQVGPAAVLLIEYRDI